MNVIDCPANEGFTVEARAVAEGPMLVLCTICGTRLDVLALKTESPEYCAVMGWVPTLSDDVVNVARPPLSALLPMDAPLSRNVTLPVGDPPVKL